MLVCLSGAICAGRKRCITSMHASKLTSLLLEIRFVRTISVAESHLSYPCMGGGESTRISTIQHSPKLLLLPCTDTVAQRAHLSASMRQHWCYTATRSLACLHIACHALSHCLTHWLVIASSVALWRPVWQHSSLLQPCGVPSGQVHSSGQKILC